MNIDRLSHAHTRPRMLYLEQRELLFCVCSLTLKFLALFALPETVGTRADTRGEFPRFHVFFSFWLDAVT